jgi:hypothetical protein
MKDEMIANEVRKRTARVITIVLDEISQYDFENHCIETAAPAVSQ